MQKDRDKCLRIRFKRDLLALNRDRMVAVAEKYFSSRQPKAVAVISGEPKLKEANGKLGEDALTLHQI